MGEPKGNSPYMPIFVDMTGKRVLVVGAGSVATRKVSNLLKHGVRPVVVAPEASAQIEEWGKTGQLELKLREFVPEDAEGSFLVYAATERPEANESVRNSAASCGALCCSADISDGEVITPSEVEKDGLHVALSTGGSSPSRTKSARRNLEQWLSDFVEIDSRS